MHQILANQANVYIAGGTLLGDWPRHLDVDPVPVHVSFHDPSMVELS